MSAAEQGQPSASERDQARLPDRRRRRGQDRRRAGPASRPRRSARAAPARSRASGPERPGAARRRGADRRDPAMSLMASRRYLLADRVERWTAKQAARVVAALGELPPDLTIVLVAREAPPKAKAPRRPRRGGRGAPAATSLSYAAPEGARPARRGSSPRPRRRGFRLDAAAARLLVERMGEGTLRLANELDRLALWAGPGRGGHGRTTSRRWSPTPRRRRPGRSPTRSSPATRPRRLRRGRAPRRAGRGGDAARLPGRAQAARRAPRARRARGRGAREAGRGEPQDAPLRGQDADPAVAARSPGDLRAATCAIADLEWWTRGRLGLPGRRGADARRAAAGAGAGASERARPRPARR